MGYEIDNWSAVNDLLSGYRIGAPLPQRGYGGGFAQQAHPNFHNPYAPQRGLPGYGMPPHPIGQTMLNQTQPTKDGQLVLPMSSSGTIAVSTAATITARPQIAAYRPERIVIANSIATAFTISDIKVGNTSQLVQAGTLPAEAFIQGAFGVEMRMDTVQTAMDFVFQVNNVDATTARQFLSVVFGRSVY
jgi:hypothetical protein